MRRSIVEPWRLCERGPSTHDAHPWPRSDDCRPLRLTGQAKYGNNRVQEIVSGTPYSIDRNAPSVYAAKSHASAGWAWDAAPS
jgi:hypothetical protein